MTLHQYAIAVVAGEEARHIVESNCIDRRCARRFLLLAESCERYAIAEGAEVPALLIDAHERALAVLAESQKKGPVVCVRNAEAVTSRLKNMTTGSVPKPGTTMPAPGIGAARATQLGM